MAETVEKPVKRATCWLNEQLLAVAKKVASIEGISQAEVLESIIEGPLERRYRKALQKEFAELGGES